MTQTNRLIVCLASLATGLCTGCASAPKSDAVAFTRNALTATETAKTGALVKGSAAEQAAIARFEVFNSDFSAANITNETKNVYAADVYFRDPFKEIHGEPEFEAYLLRGSSAVAAFSMEWLDVAESHGDYYFRWIMSVKLKRDGKDAPPGLTTGISHVRFGPDGKVIFHQDYFDAAAFLYEKIPVLGGEIRFIKRRL
jgi:SnoaL-like domain